jgi:hypothetical protein
MNESLKTAQKVKSLLENLSLLNFPYKTVQFYDVSWCMWYMPRKLVKTSFTPNKQFIILTSDQGVMTILMKTAQKLKRHS